MISKIIRHFGFAAFKKNYLLNKIQTKTFLDYLNLSSTSRNGIPIYIIEKN
jgi:hypothetical protein